MLHSDLLVSSLPYAVGLMILFSALPQAKLWWKVTIAGVLFAIRMVTSMLKSLYINFDPVYCGYNFISHSLFDSWCFSR